MKAKNIFKALALAIVMPAMLLTTACVNNEIPNENGYTFPVTINVTRQGGEATTKATYTDNGDGTGQLSFSTGDQLYVEGSESSVDFSGTLTWTSGGTFSGTITTTSEYSGTANELFTAAVSYGYVQATLLPNGYEGYNFFGFSNGSLDWDYNNAFATSKATAIEQFSYECADTYSSGFELSPSNAILNFTITGLPANTSVSAALSDGGYLTISGEVTTDGSGKAEFAMGIEQGYDLNNLSLTVGGKAITLVSSEKILEGGKIYNITRSAAPVATGHALSASVVGDVVGTDGKAYAAADKDNLPSGVTAVAMVAYKSATAGESLAIQLNASPESKNWNDAKTYASGLTAVPGGTWRLPSKADWQNMFVGCAKSGDAGASDSMNPIAGFKEKIGATGITWPSGRYWSSPGSGSNAWSVNVALYGSNARANFNENDTSSPYGVLGCLAF